MKKVLGQVATGALVLSLAIMGATMAFAAGGNPPQSASVKLTAIVDPTVSLVLDHDTGATPLAFGNVNPISSPYVQTMIATVKSNAGWTLKLFKVQTAIAGPCLAVVSDMADTTCTKVIPSAQLLWKLTPALPATYAQITSTNIAGAQTVQTSAAATASTVISIDYQLTINWTDVAASYSATHTYTLSQP